jgi:hypothetical protein
MEKNILLPAAVAAVNGILVGAAIVATRFVIDQSSPASLALLRYGSGCCCLLPPLLWLPRARFERRDLLPIGLLGVTQFGVVVCLLNFALQHISSARVAGRRVYRRQQRGRLLPVAVGAQPHHTHKRRGLPGAQPDHGRRSGGRVLVRKNHLGDSRGPRLRRRRPVDRAVANPAQPIGWPC